LTPIADGALLAGECVALWLMPRLAPGSMTRRGSVGF
jgi:hypothetical protein